MAEAVYLGCALASLSCAILLFRGYIRSRARLLLWSSLCFMCLFANNALLFADKVLFPDVYLSLWRTGSAVLGIVLLLYGLIWETEER